MHSIIGITPLFAALALPFTAAGVDVDPAASARAGRLSALSDQIRAGRQEDAAFRKELQAAAATFPLLDFDYTPGTRAPRKLALPAGTDFGGCRFQLPAGGPWDVYLTVNTPEGLKINAEYATLVPLEGPPGPHFRMAAPEDKIAYSVLVHSGGLGSTFTPYHVLRQKVADLPGAGNYLWWPCRLEGGKTYALSLQFNAPGPHELFLSAKTSPTGELAGDDFYAIHGYRPVTPGPVPPAPGQP